MEFKNLIQINFNDNFNTSKVANMNYIFDDCSSLTSLDSGMSGMFGDCKSLTTLDLSSSNTSNVASMFSGCYNLQTQITITNTSMTNYSKMFSEALTDANAYVIINYVSGAETIAQGMKSTAASANQSKITLKQI